MAAGHRQPLARAFGLHRRGKPRVLDATAGLGRDSAVLAGLGCHVTLLERSPVLHAMLADTIASFGASCPLKLLACQDARHYWADHPERHDVVYLDPMYPERGKVALAKKEAQLLRALAGEDLDADALLAPAMDHALERVVVKRHPKADWLAGRKPSHSLAGTRARYDVYLAK